MKSFQIFLLCWILAFLSFSLNGQVIQINQIFTCDTAFQLVPTNFPVYSLKMTGTIKLHGDSSLVRVVMIDQNGDHNLVYETYPLISDSSHITVAGLCDETGYLDGVLPDSIRIDIIQAQINVS